MWQKKRTIRWLFLQNLKHLQYCGIEWQGNSPLAKKEVCMYMSSLPKENHSVIPFPAEFDFTKAACFIGAYVLNKSRDAALYRSQHLVPHLCMDMLKEEMAYALRLFLYGFSLYFSPGPWYKKVLTFTLPFLFYGYAILLACRRC